MTIIFLQVPYQKLQTWWKGNAGLSKGNTFCVWNTSLEIQSIYFMYQWISKDAHCRPRVRNIWFWRAKIEYFCVAGMILCSWYNLTWWLLALSSPDTGGITLTHWGRDKMAAIFVTTISNAFSWMKINKFRLRFHWSLFPRDQLTIFQH